MPDMNKKTILVVDDAVSYTHLDVYKRQICSSGSFKAEAVPLSFLVLVR